jgi:CRP-like cAMP-binding protein
LDRDSRAALADAMENVECASREEAVREDDPGEDFYVIVEGEMEVRKRLPQKQRSVTIGWLGPGDCFGEIALLENTGRTATIGASRPTRLMKLGRTKFESLVVGRIGAARIRELLQQVRFLERLTFTAGWPFAELVKFARRCQNVNVAAGAMPLAQGAQNIWFYLIYDGAFEARDGARVLRRMVPGDYFGEISLLEGWEATATVVAIEESRCLVLSRPDFLEFFARDFRIALRMEALADQRLGGPVFAPR